MTNVSAIILGAGLSRRMGSDNKLMLPINGQPMISWVLKNVLNSKVVEVILVGSEPSMEGLKNMIPDQVKLVENVNYQSGMTSSIQSGVEVATGEGFMICLGDQPYINTATYDQLLAAFHLAYAKDQQTIVVPFYQEKRGNPSIFSTAYREDILNHEEPEGCKSIIQMNRDHMYRVDVEDQGILQDIDTKSDYDRLAQR